MPIPPWAWIAGAAALAVGGTAVAVAESSKPSSTGGTPPPASGGAPAPVPILTGHRYQVTLTFGAPTTAAALLASVVPNVQAGLNAVAPNQFRLVNAIAPNNNQVVYVVDVLDGALGTPLGVPTALNESPQTFYADVNPATVGGILVDVKDLGLSPASVGGALPPGGGGVGAPTNPVVLNPPTTNPPGVPPITGSPAPSSTPLTTSSLVIAPMLVAYAVASLNTQSNSLGFTPLPAGTQPVDPAFVSALQKFQAQVLPTTTADGRLTYLLWSYVIFAGFSAGVAGVSDQTLSDGPTIALAQRALAFGIGRGVFPSINYGASQVNGNPSDPAWTAAVATALGQMNASLGKAVAPVDGTLDIPGLAILVGASYQPAHALPGTTAVPVTPATVVASSAEITYFQQRCPAIASTVGTRTAAQNALLLAVQPNGNAADPATIAAITFLQSALPGLSNRTVAGTLDYLTYANAIAASLNPVATGGSGPTFGGAPTVTDPAVIAGLQEAVAIVLVGGRLPVPAGTPYTSGDVDGNAQTPSFLAALGAIVTVLNAALASQTPGSPVLPAGVIDENVFAIVFAVAYV